MLRLPVCHSLQDMSAGEIGSLLRHPAAGDQIAACVASFPYLQMEAQLHPITRTVLRIQLTITPAFTWKDSVHGNALMWLLWVEDSDNEHIYHSGGWHLAGWPAACKPPLACYMACAVPANLNRPRALHACPSTCHSLTCS